MSAQTIPLFPLQTVLFPRMPLPLHIFEERYKRMISNCLKEERPFGVVLIKDGVEVGGSAVPEQVGTVARIHAIEPLEDGRYHLFTEGTTRFRINHLDHDSEAYLVGSVDPISDDPHDADGIQPLVDRTTTLFRDYFDILVNYAGVAMPDYELPESAEELSFVMAAVVQAETAERQLFLEMTDTAARLERLFGLLTADFERIQRAAERTDKNGVYAHAISPEWRQKFISKN